MFVIPKLIIYVHISAHFDPLHEKEDTFIVHVCICVRRAYVKIVLFIFMDEMTEELVKRF
jgi:hypothetical protein